MSDRRFLLLITVALAAGCAIAWVDSRPNWDDAGISAGMVFVVTALLSAVMPARAAFFALAVGAWIPALAIAREGAGANLLALAIAFAGAFVGAYFGRQRRGGGSA